MAFQGTVLKVMIASPGDVTGERHMAREVIHEWNAIHATERRTVLLPIGWETHAAPAAGDRPQAIINKQLLRDCDFLIAIFWTRLGTPTGVAPSGTIEEIEEHVAAGRPAMLYFSDAPVRLESVDEEQYRALRNFKASISQRALVQEYESVSDFRIKLVRQLAQTIIERFPVDQPVAMPGVPLPVAVPAPPIPDLSAEARDLLLQAAQDPDGYALMTLTFDGFSVNTNGQNLISDRRDPRLAARWRAAVKQLVDTGLLDERDHKGEVFQITDEGYRVSSLLK